MTIDDHDGQQGLEDKLRDGLGRRAGGPVGEGDLGDLSVRVARSTRRRQRLLAGTAAVALCAGAAGGYAVSQAGASTPRTTTAARAAASPSAGPRASAVSGGAAAMAPCVTQGTSSASSEVVGSATHLFNRTTSDGIAIRAYRSAVVPVCGVGASPGSGAGSSGAVDGSTSTVSPQFVCPAGPSVSLGFSDDSAVGEGALGSPVIENPAAANGGSASTGAALPPPAPVSPNASVPLPAPTTTMATTTTTTTATTTTTTTTTPAPWSVSSRTSGAFGVTEGDPVWWVALEVSGDVATVKATFADGSSDQMTPIDGDAVLAHHVGAAAAGSSPYAVRASVQLLGASGEVLATMAFPDQVTEPPTPQPLPAPGPVPVPTLVPAPGTAGAQKGQSTAPGVASGPAAIACQEVGALPAP